MSVTYIQLTDHEFKGIIKDAFAQGAELAKKQFERGDMSVDIIREDEALKILGCSKSKLDKMRSKREIIFYTNTKPYRYSKKSVEQYMNRP